MGIVKALAAARARAVPEHLRAGARTAFASRWWAMLSVGAQAALAMTLVDDCPKTLDGYDGEAPPDKDVLRLEFASISGLL